MLLHDGDSGAQFYNLTEFQTVGARNSEARFPGLALPVAFVPGSSYAMLGHSGMHSFKYIFIFSDIPPFTEYVYISDTRSTSYSKVAISSRRWKSFSWNNDGELFPIGRTYALDVSLNFLFVNYVTYSKTRVFFCGKGHPLFV
jgi:hypothetical protein